MRPASNRAHQGWRLNTKRTAKTGTYRNPATTITLILLETSFRGIHNATFIFPSSLGSLQDKQCRRISTRGAVVFIKVLGRIPFQREGEGGTREV